VYTFEHDVVLLGPMFSCGICFRQGCLRSMERSVFSFDKLENKNVYFPSVIQSFKTLVNRKLKEIQMYIVIGAIAIGLVLLWRKRRSQNCIFCSIVQKKAKSKCVYEDDRCICIEDISPAALYHFLIIPKQHIPNVNCLRREDTPLVEHLNDVASKVMQQQGLDPTKYSTKYSLGFMKPPYNTVSHLHLHAYSLPLQCFWIRKWLLLNRIISPRQVLNNLKLA